MCYKGNGVTFANVCQILHDTEESLVATWENKVLRGLDLRVDYAELVDNLSNKEVSYSFLSDPRNTPFQDHMCLVHAVLESQGAFSDFVLQHQGEVIWNCAALCDWLQDYAKLERLFLLRTEC